MADTREVRTFASEVKFLIPAAVAVQVREWARAHLGRDPHGSGPAGDEYSTTSVYFDTEQFDVFQRRGSFGRSKYRVRRYGQDDVAFLERKLRERSVLAKRRTVTPLATLEQLRPEQPLQVWPGQWFQARLAARRLKPVCQVSYRRTARVAVSEGDIIRLTIDDALSARTADAIRFQPTGGEPMVDGQQILEFKYRHHTPAIFKRLVEEFALTPQRASKYRLGMIALGNVPVEPAAEPVVERAAVRVPGTGSSLSAGYV